MGSKARVKNRTHYVSLISPLYSLIWRKSHLYCQYTTRIFLHENTSGALSFGDLYELEGPRRPPFRYHRLPCLLDLLPPSVLPYTQSVIVVCLVFVIVPDQYGPVTDSLLAGRLVSVSGKKKSCTIHFVCPILVSSTST